MKKLLFGLLTALMLCVPAFAHPPITVFVDRVQVNFDQQPIIKDDRTLVPMRRIFEALDAEVFWDEPSQSVTAVHGTDVILFHIGQKELYKNGKLTYTMPVPAQIINDRTLVPLRAVAESLGCEVAWDGIDYIVDITSAGTTPVVKPDTPPTYEEQDTPVSGGYASKATAPDGTVVLNIDLRCDEVTTGSGKAAINGAMANETYGQGQAFLQAYQQQALADYAANPNGFQPYYYMGSYTLMREADGYASFLAAVSYHDGDEESVQYFSHTYDMATGREVDLKDLVSDSREDLEYLWMASFGALIDADPDAFYSNAEKKLEKNMDKVDFYLTEDGIVFYLSPGIIAPEETGAVSFEIQYQF